MDANLVLKNTRETGKAAASIAKAFTTTLFVVFYAAASGATAPAFSLACLLYWKPVRFAYFDMVETEQDRSGVTKGKGSKASQARRFLDNERHGEE